MDGFSGYNQINMYPDDERHMVYRMPLGIYYYTVMLFGLKNAGTTYQRAMKVIYKEHLCIIVACYAVDLVIKSKSQEVTFRFEEDI